MVKHLVIFQSDVINDKAEATVEIIGTVPTFSRKSGNLEQATLLRKFCAVRSGRLNSTTSGGLRKQSLEQE